MRNRIIITAGKQYGDFTPIETVLYTTKGGKVEKKWKCINSLGMICYQRPRQLILTIPLSVRQLTLQLKVDKLVLENKHQMGVRKRYYEEYKRNAGKRNHEFSLTFEEFNSIIIQSCFYCGAEPREQDRWNIIEHKEHPKLKHNGVDRITSTLGYTVLNTVPCCSRCNLMKNVMETSEFIQQVHNICNYFKESSTTIPQGSTSQVNGGGNGVSPDKGE